MQRTGGSSWSCVTVQGGYNSTANLMGTELLSVSASLKSILLVMEQLDCLQHLIHSIPLQSFKLPMRTDNGNFLRQLSGATFLTGETRRNFTRPTCRKPGKESRDSADEFFAIVASGMGSVGDHNFHGATRGLFSVHVRTLCGSSDSMKVYRYTRCAVTMFGLECVLHFTLEFVSK